MITLNGKNKASKFILFLFSLYICSILIFASNPRLNIYSKWIFVITFGFMIMLIVLNRVTPKLNMFIFLFLIFILFCRFSELWAKDSYLVLSQSGTLFQIFVMSLVLFFYSAYVEDTTCFVNSLFVSGIISGIFVLLFYGIEGYIKLLSTGERIGTEINNVNLIGITMSFTVTIGFYYGYIKKKKLGFLVIIIPVILLMGSGSRKALFGMIVGIILIILLDYRKKTSVKSLLKLSFTILIVILLIYWLSTLSVFETIFLRFGKMLGIEGLGKIDSSTKARMDMIRLGWNYFLEHPLTGCGIGNSRYVVLESLGRFTYLHNNFIELLASVGIFGFLCYYSIYGFVLFGLYRLYIKNDNNNAMILFVILLVQLMLEFGMVSYYSKMTYIYLTLGASEIYIQKNNEIKVLNNDQECNTSTVIK